MTRPPCSCLPSQMLSPPQPQRPQRQAPPALPSLQRLPPRTGRQPALKAALKPRLVMRQLAAAQATKHRWLSRLPAQLGRQGLGTRSASGAWPRAWWTPCARARTNWPPGALRPVQLLGEAVGGGSWCCGPFVLMLAWQAAALLMLRPLKSTLACDHNRCKQGCASLCLTTAIMTSLHDAWSLGSCIDAHPWPGMQHHVPLCWGQQAKCHW